jgi:hypothetical protein
MLRDGGNMSELEIRAAIRKICNDLDLRARTIACGAVIPLVVGVGMATTDCSQKDETTTSAGGAVQPLYAAPGGGGVGGAGGMDAGAAGVYMAPGGAGGMDGGGAPEYMAPGGGGAGGT